MFYLKTMKIVTLAMLALFIPRLSWGAESQSQTSVDEYFTGLNYGTYSDLVASQNAFTLEIQPADTMQLNRDIYGGKTKSVRRAFVYSLLLPGAGELYGESKLKAAAFLGLEALFWVGYFNYDGKGDDKKTEYRNLADSSWDASAYRDYLISEYLIDFTYTYDTITIHINNVDSIKNSDPALYNQIRADQDVIYNMEESLSILDRSQDTIGFTHHSVKISNNEYYENIGKYDQFTYGWGGTEQNLTTSIRLNYLDWRRDANSFYDKAKWSVVASMANHIISAVDAALTVKNFNRKQDRFSEASLKIRMVPEEGGISPRAVLTVKFN